MTHADSTEPQLPGRRALPAVEDGGETAAPRRSRHDAAGPVMESSPRRASTNGMALEQRSTIHRWLKRRSIWAALVVLVLIGLLIWAVLRPTAGGPQVVVPIVASTSSSTASSVPGRSASTPQDPSESTAPLPGTVSPAPVSPPSPEPTPAGSATAGLVVLNDARFTAPEGWTIHGDEMIENARRAVRLSNPETDARLQAVTLEKGVAKLTDSCVSLVDLQQTQFADVTRQLVVPIGVETSSGAGVRCGFTGVRSSDGVANTVTFTLVSRASDSHVLMLRTTVPATVPSDAAAVLQLGTMSCEASASFGVTLPLC